MNGAAIPAWRLSVQDIDVTRDLLPFATRIEFIDNEHGEADEISVTMADDGRFLGGTWLPSKGDRLGLSIGYAGQSTLNCGVFEVDSQEIELDPDQLTLKALSACVTQSLRTKRTSQFDKTNLARIVSDIAKRHKLEVVGTIADIPIRRRTQNDRTDLRFLTELGQEYGYRVKLDRARLLFHSIDAIDALPPIQILDRSQIAKDARFTRQTVATYSKAVCEFTDPTSGKTHKATVTASGVTSGDTLRRHIQADSIADAELKARAALTLANRRAQTSASITIEGTIKAVAGASLSLRGLGILDGVYKINRAVHRWQNQAAWIVNLELQGLQSQGLESQEALNG